MLTSLGDLSLIRRGTSGQSLAIPLPTSTAAADPSGVRPPAQILSWSLVATVLWHPLKYLLQLSIYLTVLYVRVLLLDTSMQMSLARAHI